MIVRRSWSWSVNHTWFFCSCSLQSFKQQKKVDEHIGYLPIWSIFASSGLVRHAWVSWLSELVQDLYQWTRQWRLGRTEFRSETISHASAIIVDVNLMAYTICVWYYIGTSRRPLVAFAVFLSSSSSTHRDRTGLFYSRLRSISNSEWNSLVSRNLRTLHTWKWSHREGIPMVNVQTRGYHCGKSFHLE